MTTGATHAPASNAATAPMTNATATLPRFDGSAPIEPEKRDRSISKTSNIASASATKITAIATLNHGEALIVPNVPAVMITITPRTP